MPQQKQLASNSKANNFPQVSKEQLQAISITTNPSLNLLTLSRKHKVLLIFLRAFGCAVCKINIGITGDLYDDMLKLNCVPVFVHMEDRDTAENFFCSVRFVFKKPPSFSRLTVAKYGHISNFSY